MNAWVKLNISIFLWLFTIANLHTQDQYLDSLKTELKESKDFNQTTELMLLIGEYEPIFRTTYWDSIAERCGNKKELQVTKALVLNNIGFIGDMNGQNEIAETNFTKSIELFLALKDTAKAADGMYNLSVHYQDIGEYGKSLDLMYKAMKFYKQTKKHSAVGEVYNGLAVTYDYLGNPLKSIQNYDSAYAILSKLKDTIRMANVLTNLASIHSDLGDNETAKKYYFQSNDLYLTQYDDKNKNILTNLNNLATIYWAEGNIEKAKGTFESNLIIYKQNEDQLNVFNTLINLGAIYAEEKKHQLAEDCYNEGISIARKLNFKYELCSSLKAFANFLFKQDRIKEAETFALEGYLLSKDLQSLELEAESAQLLARVYEKQNNYLNAFKYQKIHDALDDSLVNRETLSAVVGQKFEIEYLTKVATDSVKNAEAQKVKDAELLASKEESKRLIIQADQEKQKRIFLFIGLGLSLVFGIVMFNRFKVTNKQKSTIEIQKKETEEKNKIIEHQHKEISDSINYAEMIQQSVLPQIKIEDILPDSFVLMKPKDIVSGDFFWLEDNEKYSYFAVADCTGHGIPGAFISMIGTIILNEIYNSKKLVLPNEILDELNRLIKITLTNKEGVTMKDGMDISFAMLDKKTNELFYSGANNPLWIISTDNEKKKDAAILQPNISENGLNLFEIKADKQPVGKYEDNVKAFSSNKIQLSTGDSIYLFTDGYADQFGGPNGKKLMYKPFKKLLISIWERPMPQQKDELLTKFNQWKGKLEQVDDVCIAGIKIT